MGNLSHGSTVLFVFIYRTVCKFLRFYHMKMCEHSCHTDISQVQFLPFEINNSKNWHLWIWNLWGFMISINACKYVAVSKNVNEWTTNQQRYRTVPWWTKGWNNGIIKFFNFNGNDSSLNINLRWNIPETKSILNWPVVTKSTPSSRLKEWYKKYCVNRHIFSISPRSNKNHK